MEIKVYYLKSNVIVIGKEDKDNNETLFDTLQFLNLPGVTMDGRMQFMNLCIPIGAPVNQIAVDMLKVDLGILFEIKDYDKGIIEKYNSQIEALSHPTIVQPIKKGKIIG